MAGDGENKYIKIYEPSLPTCRVTKNKFTTKIRIASQVIPIVQECLTPEEAEGYTMLSDERFKLLIKFCKDEKLSDEQRKELLGAIDGKY